MNYLYFDLVMFSVCSAGNPKGAMITHQNVVSDCSAFVKVTEVNLGGIIFPHINALALGLQSGSTKVTAHHPSWVHVVFRTLLETWARSEL